MAHAFETAPTSRAKCRACGLPIEKGTIRFGERLPNAYGEGEMTLWFHPLCAAYKRPEPVLETLATADAPGVDRDRLETEAKFGAAHRRLPRLSGIEKASSGRAHCRACREIIAKGEWRVTLVFYDEGRFEPSGFVHLRCAPGYFDTAEITGRLAHFTTLSEDDLREIRAELGS